MIGFFFYSTQYLQGVLGFSAFRAGVAGSLAALLALILPKPATATR